MPTGQYTRSESEKKRIASMAGNMKGKRQTPEHIKSRIAVGQNHGGWKGDEVGYNALHAWVRRNKAKPVKCVSCGLKKPLEVANISQLYLRKLSDWEWVCRSCHMTFDGRLDKLHQNRLK